MDLVSCLCLTRDRPRYLHRVIRCFQQQTWKRKELVIVYDFDDIETERFLERYKNTSTIKIVKNIKENASVGYLRNIAVQNASGRYCAQWDDDDYYDQNRLSFQINQLRRMKKYKAIVLDSWYSVYLGEENVVISPKYTYEGTIIAERTLLLKYPYPDYTRITTAGGGEIGEDTFVINQLKEEGVLAVINKPHLYYYFIHGANTCSPDHFVKMLSCSKKLSNSKTVYSSIMKTIMDTDNIYYRMTSSPDEWFISTRNLNTIHASGITIGEKTYVISQTETNNVRLSNSTPGYLLNIYKNSRVESSVPLNLSYYGFYKEQKRKLKESIAGERYIIEDLRVISSNNYAHINDVVYLATVSGNKIKKCAALVTVNQIGRSMQIIKIFEKMTKDVTGVKIENNILLICLKLLQCTVYSLETNKIVTDRSYEFISAGKLTGFTNLIPIEVRKRYLAICLKGRKHHTVIVTLNKYLKLSTVEISKNPVLTTLKGTVCSIEITSPTSLRLYACIDKTRVKVMETTLEKFLKVPYTKTDIKSIKSQNGFRRVNFNKRWSVYSNTDSYKGNDAHIVKGKTIKECRTIAEREGFNGFVYTAGNRTCYFRKVDPTLLYQRKRPLRGATLHIYGST